jgi:hypothetical protein
VSGAPEPTEGRLAIAKMKIVDRASGEVRLRIREANSRLFASLGSPAFRSLVSGGGLIAPVSKSHKLQAAVAQGSPSMHPCFCQH